MQTASPRKSAVNRTDIHLCKLQIQKANSLRTPNPKPAAQVESVSSYEGSINDRYVGGAWRHIWELASASYLDRRHRVLWWRLLHGSLMCGAYKSYIGRATPAQANCPFFLFFFFFFGWESYSLHIYRHATKETTSVNRKAIHSRSCKLPSLLG